MDVYRGADKVATLGSYDELRVGANKPAFIYEGGNLVHPNPVKDGLVLWYDFSGRTNGDAERGVAEDLSGNGNHGTLQNFNYIPESGYDKNKLLFDGVDDNIRIPDGLFGGTNSLTITLTFEVISTLSSLEGFLMTDAGGVGRVWLRSLSDGLSFNTYFGTGMDYSTSISNSISTKGKVFVVIVVNRENGTQSTYLDGRFIGETDISAASGIATHNGGIIIGARSGYSPPHAEYSDVKIYNRPLTAEEITHNYAIEKERFGIE